MDCSGFTLKEHSPQRRRVRRGFVQDDIFIRFPLSDLSVSAVSRTPQIRLSLEYGDLSPWDGGVKKLATSPPNCKQWASATRANSI